MRQHTSIIKFKIIQIFLFKNNFELNILDSKITWQSHENTYLHGGSEWMNYQMDSMSKLQVAI